MRSQILGSDRRKSRVKLEKTVIFPGKSEAIVPILPWKDRSQAFTHSWPKLSFILFKMSQKMSKKTYNFRHFPNLYLSSHIVKGILNLIIPPYVYIIKVDYSKFGISNLFFKSYRRKTFGFRLYSPPLPLVKEGLSLEDVFFVRLLGFLWEGSVISASRALSLLLRKWIFRRFDKMWP